MSEEQERIADAAIQGEDGRILRGYGVRHTALRLNAEVMKFSLQGATEGFITSTNRFVDRKEAMKIARKANQLLPNPERNPFQAELYTEDVFQANEGDDAA